MRDLERPRSALRRPKLISSGSQSKSLSNDKLANAQKCLALKARNNNSKASQKRKAFFLNPKALKNLESRPQETDNKILGQAFNPITKIVNEA